MEVEIVQADQVTLDLYVRSLGASCWNYRFQTGENMEGWAHLAFSLPLCGALLKPEGGEEGLRQVEAIVATPILETDAYHDDFTVMAKFVKALAPEIEKAWASVFEMCMTDINLHTAPSSIDTGKPTDPAIHIKIEVKSKQSEDHTLGLCYLLSTLEPVLPRRG